MINVLNKTKISKNWLVDIRKNKAVYNFLIGGRNGRKSTKIQSKILDDYFKDGKLFILIRRKTDETVTEKWFTPWITEQVAKNHKKLITFKKTIVKGERYTGYFFLTDLDGGNAEIIGKVMYLSMEQKYKSNEHELYKKMYNVVFEEFIANTDKDYLTDEVQKLINLISTIFRDRDAAVYLIGNTLNGQETNPYFRFFEIDDLPLKVNDLYICENEYKIKFLIGYIANILPEDIPQYQKLKNNLVGTTGEWKEDKNLLNIPLKDIDGEITPLYFIIKYRNKEFYIYSIAEREYKRDYLYITSEFYTENGIATLEEFKKTIPPQHQNYNNALLHFLYPKFFIYDYSTKDFIFKPQTKATKYDILNIDEAMTEREKAKNDNIKLLEKLNQIIYNTQVFCDNKSLLFWLRNERKDYIKRLVW